MSESVGGEAAGGGGGRGGGADTELKTKKPHVNVGKNTVIEGSLEVKNFRQYRQTKRRDGKRQREEKDWKKED